MDTTAQLTDALVMAVCAAYVALHAWERYDTPRTHRRSTTRLLFVTTGCGYVLLTLALFAALCWAVGKPSFMELLGVSEAKALLDKIASPPVLAALLLTTLLPQTPGLAKVDALLLQRFRSWGRIPHRVRDLAGMLTVERFPIRTEDLPGLAAWVAGDASPVPHTLAARIDGPADDPSRRRFARTLLLYRAVADLRDGRGYGAVAAELETEWEEAKAAFQVYLAQAEAHFVLSARLAQANAGGVEAQELAHANHWFKAASEAVFKRLVNIAAPALLAGERTQRGVEARLRAMGFRIEEQGIGVPLPLGVLVFNGVLLALLVSAAVSVAPPLPGPGGAFGTVLVVAGSQALAAMLAVLPKLRWGWFRPDPANGGDLPYLGWLASAAAAGLLGFALERLGLALHAGSLSAALDFAVHPLRPTAPMAAAAALVVAVVCDLPPVSARPLVQRASDAAACAALMLAAMTLCKQFIPAPVGAGPVPWWFPFAFTAALGGVAGWVAPSAYRRARDRRLGPPHPAVAGGVLPGTPLPQPAQ